MPQPKCFLIEILVGINPPNNNISYFDRKIVADPLSVNVGDEVGFLVQIVLPNGRRTPPYTLAFSDASFFGMSTLDVPAGGTSPFLRVLSLVGKVKYTLGVKGLGTVLDPEIQSGDGFRPANDLAIAKFVFAWDVGAQTATYTKDGTAVPYSTPVPHGNTVEFLAINAGGAVQNFTVSFPPNTNNPTLWASPFDFNNSKFVAPQASPADLGPLTVFNQADAGSAFAFTASVTVNGQVTNLSPAINPYIQL